MAQPTILQLGNRQRLEAESRRGADFQLGVDLGSKLPGGLTVRPDTRPVPDSVFVIGEIPDSSPQVGADTTDPKRTLFAFHDSSLRELPRYKTPQTTPQKGISEELSERQRSTSQQVMAHGHSSKRREGDSNPRSRLPRTQHFQCCTIGHSVISPRVPPVCYPTGGRENGSIPLQRWPSWRRGV